MRPPTGGTYFDNPSYDCKHASQPHIFDVFSKLELQPERLSQTMDPNAKFHIIGNHPLAGKYSSLEMFYVNGLWRLQKTYDDHYDELEVSVWAITGGCDEEWSTQEMRFKARSNVGKEYSVVNVWLTKWSGHRIVEVRTYVDGAVVVELLSENETWFNSTQDTIRTEYMPGPRGMPPAYIMESFRESKRDL
ncbi:hypothetical protein OIDMADRAFT_116473 [Oidiodendron maius Zn]|uniref:SnoaL-like domain-containing protein n=1 Tax=Oidiodendron maius (strain Zn) TaxID=913774 RepID=A0A0C3D287_OIDMZ|nr:hypothetical protein OIDMADRAFT_116473 [Oidiodendron maius Zn]